MNRLPHKASLRPTPRESPTEKWLSILLLGVLVGIAAVMLWLAARFDPGRFQWQPGKAGVDAATSPAPASTVEHPMDVVTGLHPLAPTESYAADTLSDKIDGKAELYLSAGFQHLKTRRFALTADSAVWLERYLYDMGQYRNAFAVYTAQRRTNAEPLDLTSDGYASSNGLFFVHGPFYMEIIASQVSEAARSAALELARAFVRNQPVQSKPLEEADLLPAAEQLPGSLSLIAANAFGIDGFDWVHTARYQRDSAEAMGFVAKQASVDEARRRAVECEAYFLEYGGEAISWPGLPPGAKMINIMEMYELVANQGRYVFGVHEATDRDLALEVLLRIRQKVVQAESDLVDQ